MSSPSLAARPFLSPERFAVSLMFLANGFLIGSWAPKIPEFAIRLDLDEGALGLMIMCFGIGSLCAMPLVGLLISRSGSRMPVLWLAAMTVTSLPLVTLAPSIWTAAIALFLFGGMIGGMDVAMNANAVEVEKRLDRAIMSSCHGFWSLGGVAGATLGGLLIAYFGVHVHALLASLLVVLALALAWPRLLADPPPVHPDHTSPNMTAAPRPGLLTAGATVWLTGIICLIMMTPEGAVLDWGALYLRQELAASPALSGLAFGAFSAAMALMRFLGDLVRDRLGAVRTFQISATLAMIGLGAAGLAPSAEWAVAGFAVAGLGLANTVPIAFSAAGNLPGLPQGMAISIVTFMGYSGLLFAPSVIGFIAEHTGFAPIYLAIPVFIAIALAFSGLMRHADRVAS
ncbi:MAG: MFS transporter [Hoeflea sp.]|uniref:MFS transporter n=1 Tax=Hoeflea sp. TaxID=1940281 RepID=UPI001DE1721D|nr:MFS transporter [Hoeflea sp.]MBU4529919.1 MFS transporter [Alphaproteobacteria bacterium]MBU4547060.1 MFS transporter [Alphaproteobacteria bacterium]MBU4548673.1 MFS transporter [Alphaproteobacteria bacterium]MBV1722412.1 MFS transporter [Hoeflea sp.]MBV1762432.1 MFS transporter [Hoeflea sp.]